MRSHFLFLLLIASGLCQMKVRQAPRSMVKQHLTVQTNNAAATLGTNFVYSYLNSHLVPTDTSYTENLFLTITNPGTTDATVSITSRFPQFNNQTVTVPAGISSAVQITPADIQVDYMDKQLSKAFTEYKSIWVSSSSPVSLVATNQLSDFSSEDKFAILPICQLGTAYKAVVDETADSSLLQATNVVTVIATEDDTTVSISPTVSGKTLLDKGQQLSVAVPFTASAADIVADKPVAAFSGAVCGYGYLEGALHCSHEALMLSPLSSYGKVFPAFKFQPQIEGELLVLVSQNDTIVSSDGEKWLSPLNTDVFWIVGMDSGVYIESDKPIYVVQVGNTNYMDQGAPFFAAVPSPNVFTSGPVQFATALTTDEEKNMVHFARIVTFLHFIGQIQVDNYTPNGLIYRRMGKSQYYFVDVAIQKGDHIVTGLDPNAQFAVVVYGYGFMRSYGFNPGLNLPTNGQC